MRHGSFSKKFITGKKILQIEGIDSVDVFSMILSINIIQLSSVFIILIFPIFLFVMVRLICLRNSILYLNNLKMENCIRIRDVFVKYKYIICVNKI